MLVMLMADRVVRDVVATGLQNVVHVKKTTRFHTNFRPILLRCGVVVVHLIRILISKRFPKKGRYYLSIDVCSHVSTVHDVLLQLFMGFALSLN